MTTKAKVSIIVPIYNVAKYIERCVRSLFEQTLVDIEYIFIDDCSPDNSIEILNSIITQYPHRAPQIKIFHHERNAGLASARNTGLKFATGEYVAHCDSDDWVEVTMYEKLYNAALQCNADIVGCDYRMHFGDRTEDCQVIDPMDNKVSFLKSYISSDWTVIWNLLVKRSVYVDNNVWGYPGLDFGEDYGLSVRLFFYSKNYVRVKTPLYNYNRCNINSIVHKSNNTRSSMKATNALIQINSNVAVFFTDKNLYNVLIKELSWRILAGKRGWLFEKERYEDYRNLFPESNNFIASNPFCSKKDKFCQWIIMKPWLSSLLYVIKAAQHILTIIK